MPPPTIIAHKSTFLATQTLHLSQGLAPSETWRAANERADEGSGGVLAARAVDDALYRLNHVLAQHSRRVYAPQASRLVAEQIEGLFYAEAARALRGDADDEGDEGGDDAGALERERLRLRVGADFTTDEAIASLPPTWDVHKPREATSQPLEARRYAELVTTLTTLSAKRQEARERVARLRRMAALLAPFDNTSSASSLSLSSPPNDDESSSQTAKVQKNLVTRNGEIERELERMRLLVARVAGRVAQLPDKSAPQAADGNGAEESTDLESLERDKVGRLLDLL